MFPTTAENSKKKNFSKSQFFNITNDKIERIIQNIGFYIFCLEAEIFFNDIDSCI